MLQHRRSGNRLILRAPGQILAWAAAILFLIQTLGGAAFLARQFAPGDDFAQLALQYLCTGSGISQPGKDGKQQAPAMAGHDHCLLCQAGWLPVAPVQPLLLTVTLTAIILTLAGYSIVARPQATTLAHRSRAPPLAA
ncbi:MAG TPA: DUF2946 family protein [Terriglobales bacterium]|nr:DUF2946 family protein [Terriglobales bacterium]